MVTGTLGPGVAKAIDATPPKEQQNGDTLSRRGVQKQSGKLEAPGRRSSAKKASIGAPSSANQHRKRRQKAASMKGKQRRVPFLDVQGRNTVSSFIATHRAFQREYSVKYSNCLLFGGCDDDDESSDEEFESLPGRSSNVERMMDRQCFNCGSDGLWDCICCEECSEARRACRCSAKKHTIIEQVKYLKNPIYAEYKDDNKQGVSLRQLFNIPVESKAKTNASDMPDAPSAASTHTPKPTQKAPQPNATSRKQQKANNRSKGGGRRVLDMGMGTK